MSSRGQNIEEAVNDETQTPALCSCVVLTTLQKATGSARLKQMSDSSVCLSVRPSVRLSVSLLQLFLPSFEVLDPFFLCCMIA